MPIQNRDDNVRFFDHRREHSRTDWDNNGLPRPKNGRSCSPRRARAADKAGHLRFAWPKKHGGKGGSNLWMAVIREHLAAKGLGLFNDLQTEHSIVGNNPFIVMFEEFATPDQYARYSDDVQKGRLATAFGLTEPEPRLRCDVHGNPCRAADEKDGKKGWLVNGEEDVDQRHAHAELHHDVRTHRAVTTATRAASPASSFRRTLRA
jgi:acyl-CoA dehydrogenase